MTAKIKVSFEAGEDVRFEGEFTPKEFLDFVTAPMLMALDDGPALWNKAETDEGNKWLDDTNAWVQGAHSYVLGRLKAESSPS